MRTFVLARGKTRRFWNVLLHAAGSGYTTSTCAAGPGEQESVECASDDEARAEVARLVAERRAEGYVETTDAPWHQGFESPDRGALEDALAADPDDRTAHMAYADHLAELGDPRGAFVQAQLALEDPAVPAAGRKGLARREAALLREHERAWLGPLAGLCIDHMDQYDWETWDRPLDHTWRRGWIDALAFHFCSPHAVAAMRNRLPLLRLLRELRLLYGRYDADRYGFHELSQLDLFGNVRVFQVGEGTQNLIRDTVGARSFYSKMPRLEELHLLNGELPFGHPFPHLRKLTAHAGWGVYPLGDLAANTSLKNLTHLSLWPRSHANDGPGIPNEDGGQAYITRAGAVALARSPNLPNLRHLVLRNSDLGDEGVRAMVEAGLFRRLETLDLAGGCVTDAGARALAACPDLPRLASLHLDGNCMTAAGVAELQATGVPMTAHHQHGPAAVHTIDYLYDGDCE